MAVFMGKLMICSSASKDYTKPLDYTQHSYRVSCQGLLFSLNFKFTVVARNFITQLVWLLTFWAPIGLS